jgi:hypothetical protein
MGIFLFAAASRLALGPIQPPIQRVQGVKRPGREADHSLPSNATPRTRLYGEVLNEALNASSW